MVYALESEYVDLRVIVHVNVGILCGRCISRRLRGWGVIGVGGFLGLWGVRFVISTWGLGGLGFFWDVVFWYYMIFCWVVIIWWSMFEINVDINLIIARIIWITFVYIFEAYFISKIFTDYLNLSRMVAAVQKKRIGKWVNLLVYLRLGILKSKWFSLFSVYSAIYSS